MASNKSKKKNNKEIGGGIGLFTIITIVLVILKLFNLINISWLWVLSPIWFPICLVILIGIIFGIFKFIAKLLL